jgi:phosphatidylglycerol---prolipoprotein diacylglyceryl transferase
VIEINIDPTMVRLGALVITWHGFFSMVGLMAGIWLAVVLARRTSLTEDNILTISLWGIAGAIIGARLVHVLDYWHHYQNNLLQILLINEGGIAIWGAVLGGVAAGALYCRFARLSVAEGADVAGPGLLLGQIIGRIGDIINGEHHGVPAELPWSFVYTHPETLGQRGVPNHPAIVYEMLWNGAALAFVLWLFGRVPSGVVFWLYLWLYSLGRFIVGFYRLDPAVAFGLQQQQIIGIGSLVVATVALAWTYLARGRTQPRMA